jgi:spoIIIJ-associated protein
VTAPSTGFGGQSAAGSSSGKPRKPRPPRERVSTMQREESDVSAQQVGEEAKKFLSELVDAFGLVGSVDLREDGDDLELNVSGADLGLMVGPRGNTLLAVQDLTRVASQRRLGDHDTRLRVDIGGYRERRREALSRFALDVAAQVASSGEARALEPMPSADRKVIHDVLTENAGVVTRSEGDDPNRRVVIAPANA